MRNVLAAGLACIGLAASIGLFAGSAEAQLQAPAAVQPDVLMSKVTAEVVAILKRDAAAGQPTDVAQLVETKILPLFDFQHMTRIAVARNWLLASPEQQSALVEQFTTLLVRTYSTALSGYQGQEVRYLPLRAAAGDTEVRVRSSVPRSGAEALTIDYDMEQTLAGWKVFDVKVAAVSLVLTHRETFAAIVRDGGIDGLIKALADKNRQSAPPLKQ